MRSKGTWVLLFYVLATLLLGLVFTYATQEVLEWFRVYDIPILGQNFLLSQLIGGGIAVLIAIYAAFLNQRSRDFVEQCIEELGKVAFPSGAETRKSTYTVIAVCLVAAVILGFFDTFFGWLSNNDFFLG